MVERSNVVTAPSPSRWFPVYYAVVVAGGAALLIGGLLPLPGLSWPLVLLWAALILVMDAAPVKLPGGGFITVSSTVDYAGILILGPVPTALAEFAATLVLEIGIQRRPVHKALFNASAFSGTVILAGGVFTLLGGVPGAQVAFPQVLVPLLGMGLAYYALNTSLVSLVIALSRGRNPWQVWQVNYIWTIFHMVASLPFGVAIAVAHLEIGVWGVLLFVVPLLFARHTFKLYVDTKRDLLDFAAVLAGVIDEFDPYTRRHSQRVGRLAALLAREMGLPERQVEVAEYSGLLHDIGKIKMAQRDIILKPGRLTEAEWAVIREHPDHGADLLERVGSLKKLGPVVRYHHERMDGDGYHRLDAATVPLSARIITVADAFDAMTSDRVYRRALTLEVALREVHEHAGTQFDPAVVAALDRLAARGEIAVEETLRVEDLEVVSRPGVVNAGLV